MNRDTTCINYTPSILYLLLMLRVVYIEDSCTQIRPTDTFHFHTPNNFIETNVKW